MTLSQASFPKIHEREERKIVATNKPEKTKQKKKEDLVKI